MQQIPALAQQEEVEYFIQTVTAHLPASKERLEVYRQAQLSDLTCAAVRNYCVAGWPRKQTLTSNLLPYWNVCGEPRTFCCTEARLLYLSNCRMKHSTRYIKATKAFKGATSELLPRYGGQKFLKLLKVTYKTVHNA